MNKNEVDFNDDEWDEYDEDDEISEETKKPENQNKFNNDEIEIEITKDNRGQKFFNKNYKYNNKKKFYYEDNKKYSNNKDYNNKNYANKEYSKKDYNKNYSNKDYLNNEYSNKKFSNKKKFEKNYIFDDYSNKNFFNKNKSYMKKNFYQSYNEFPKEENLKKPIFINSKFDQTVENYNLVDFGEINNKNSLNLNNNKNEKYIDNKNKESNIITKSLEYNQYLDNNKEYNDYNNYVTNNLISFIIEQIKKVELSIDNKNILNINNNIYTNDILNEENSTYELIKQNFNLLINKIKFMHEENFKKKSEILKMLDGEKNKNMQLSSNIKKIDQNSKNEILSMRQALEMKTTEIQQLKDRLNLVTSNQNNNNDNLLNIFEQQYNEIFAKLKNFTEFYCKNINTEIGQIILQMPNFSLSDPIDKKISDIFYTIKNVINYIENNMKNNRGNNIINNFDNYMKEINGLNNKIKRLSELFKKNENLLKQITDENRELKQKNIQLQNLINSMKKSPKINNKKINENKNSLNNNNNDNLWKVSDGYHYNIVSPNNNNFNTENNKKNMLELKDLISLHQTKNDNLMNEFYNKDQQITSLENEANKLIQENYAGNNINIINNSKNNNLNNNNFNNKIISNQMYTFKNENEDNNYGDENYVQEEIGDDVCNDMNMNMNNNDDNDCPPCHDDNDMDYNDMYDENCDDGNEYNEEDDNYYNEEIINDNDDNNY